MAKTIRTATRENPTRRRRLGSLAFRKFDVDSEQVIILPDDIDYITIKNTGANDVKFYRGNATIFYPLESGEKLERIGIRGGSTVKFDKIGAGASSISIVGWSD